MEIRSPLNLDILFIVQEDHYDQNSLYNSKILLNFLNKFAIEFTEVEIELQKPFIVSDNLVPVELKQHISSWLEDFKPSIFEEIETKL